MNSLLRRLNDLSRIQKRAIQVFVDSILIIASFAAAMTLRLESFGFAADPMVWVAVLLALPVCLLIFAKLGFYRAVVRYISGDALRTILIGIFASSTVLFSVSQLFGLPIPRSVSANFGLLAFLSVGGVRFVFRSICLRQQMCEKKRVIIYGAGASGRQVLGALQQGQEYAPIAFVDDAKALQGTDIAGIRVHPSADLRDLIGRYDVAAVLLAVPSASLRERKVILGRLESLSVQVQTIPGMMDLVSGKVQFNEFSDVPVEDLLGRDPVPPRADLMGVNIRGRVVMVSGAGGSIGSELCRQIIKQAPQTLILFEMSEPSLYAIDMELRSLAEAQKLAVRIVPLLGTVRNGRRVGAVMKRFGVQTIYHAAAYKHVPLVEENVVEGLSNNVFGTHALAQAAEAAGVEDFILISTDKAVRPSNIMGASKRIAEMICQAFAARESGTRFSMVRFGNVLGSSGSVIPRFRAQIAAGGPVTVTHPEITRYFMTIPEASQLVIQAGAMARAGDVFILDMGRSVRIADLAVRIVRLSGLKPYVPNPGFSIDGVDDRDGDIAIDFTGLRPGEKLYEELLIGRESVATDHPRILKAREAFLAWNELQSLLDRLSDACESLDIEHVRAILRGASIGYKPTSDIADLLWCEGWSDEQEAAPRSLLSA